MFASVGTLCDTAGRTSPAMTKGLEMILRDERTECDAQHLERLDPKRQVELEDTFTKHLADAISTCGPTERQQAVDKGTEACEDALDGALYELHSGQAPRRGGFWRI
jgi:hypothetical protein